MLNKNKFKIFFLSLLLGASFFYSLAEDDYHYQSVLIEIKINSDSTFEVIEDQTFWLNGNFGFFYRDLALKDIDHISEIEVYDGERLLDQSEYQVSGVLNKEIRWDFPRRDFKGEYKNWKVKYKVHGGLKFFEDWDELYWNAIWPDRDVSVKYAEVIVRLPQEVDPDQVSQYIYLGQLDSKLTSLRYEQISANSFRYWAYHLEPGHYLTIDLTWPKGLVQKPFLGQNQFYNWLALILAILIPVLVFILSFNRWRQKGRDLKLKKTIIAQYQPPKDLSPAMTGLILNQRIDLKEITATIIDLASRGYLKIHEGQKGFLNSREYIFEKLKDAQDLKPYEQKIMNSLFSKPSLEIAKNILKGLFGLKAEGKDQSTEQELKTVSTTDLKNNFYQEIPVIKKALYQDFAQTGYFNGNIQDIRKKYSQKYAILIGISFVLIFIGFISLDSLGFWAIRILFLGFGILSGGIIGLIFAYLMPVITQVGLEIKWQVLGFKEYLNTAERFRIGAETVETFSKFLPYAMIFGVEKKWAERFSQIAYESPSWYVSSGGVNQGSAGFDSFTSLSSGLSAFASSLSSTLGSRPGSSGAGGGGSAGGGGGGGGGGAG